MASGETNIIGRGITIRGNLSGSEPLVIEGVVEGGLTLENHLTVESSGRVKADVDVESLTVSGIVEGNIRAQHQVAVRAGARVVGNIVASRIAIEDGAFFQGSIDMEFDLPEGV